MDYEWITPFCVFVFVLIFSVVYTMFKIEEVLEQQDFILDKLDYIILHQNDTKERVFSTKDSCKDRERLNKEWRERNLKKFKELSAIEQLEYIEKLSSSVKSNLDKD